MIDSKLITLSADVEGKKISLETGVVAKQSDGSVILRVGDTMILATAVSSKLSNPAVDSFVPLTVNYKERTYAAGKIPGGFFKREARPTKKETLASRLTDRSLRPLFPEGFTSETNVTTMVMSYDGINDADVLSITAASASLMISCIPFAGPISAVRIGRVEGKFIVNPTKEEMLVSDMNLIVSGTLKGILMVEGEAQIIAEEDLVKAIESAKPHIDALCNLQIQLAEKINPTKFEFETLEIPAEITKLGNEKYRDQIVKILQSFVDKKTRDVQIAELKTAMKVEAEALLEGGENFASPVIEEIVYEESRRMVIVDGTRVDGRKNTEIRSLNSMIKFLPRAHGSSLFTRGQTQALVACTLGTADDQQLVEGLDEMQKEQFMLHYNFPGYATGECKFDRGPGRREIGHGELARRALMPVLPSDDDFAYTIRLVSEIMESNGSSSMASVCGGSLAMFDAGVPLKAACAGIAMGLIKEGDKTVVLSDILGMEDHLGDMDFKLTGTRTGVTAFQMDVKLAEGISMDVLKEAVAQASAGRNHILDHMETTIKEPKTELSEFAPQMTVIQIPVDKIGMLIGPGGKNIKRICEETEAKVNIDDDGKVSIAAVDGESMRAAIKQVELITAEAEVGKTYKGKVVSIQSFGAFVEILPGKDGLLHISEIDKKRINKVEDVLNIGDEVEVKVLEKDNFGKIKLSRKALL